MADEGNDLAFRLVAETGIFNSNIKESASVVKTAADQMIVALGAALASTDELNAAKTAIYNEELAKAGTAAKSASTTITDAMAAASGSVGALNTTSTGKFQAEVKAAAEAATASSNQIIDAETRRAAILAKFRQQQGPDRNTSTFNADSTPNLAAVAQQPRTVRNAFYSEQRGVNESLTSEAGATSGDLRADIIARSSIAAEAASQREAAALAHLNAALGITALSSEAAAGATATLAEAEGAVGHSTSNGISTRIKADAALRALNGDIFTGVRAAGTFAASIGALEPLLASAFTIVGAAALIGILVDLGYKAFKAAENFYELKDAIASIHSEQIEVDVKLKADKSSIESELEKIVEDQYYNPKKPDLGRAKAQQQHLTYQRAQGLDTNDYFYSEAYKKLPDVVKGTGATSFESQYKDIAAGDIPDRLNRINATVASLQSRLAQGKENNGLYVTSGGGLAPDISGFRDPKAGIEAQLALAQQLQTRLRSGSQVRDLSIQATQSDIGKDSAASAYKQGEQNKQAAAKAKEEARQAQQAIIQEQRRGLDEAQAQRETSLSQVADYWTDLATRSQFGSQVYLNAVDEANKAIAGVQRETLSQQREFGKESAAAASNANNRDLSKLDVDDLKASGTGNSRYLQSAQQSGNELQQRDDAAAEQRIHLGEATGAISKYDAAQQTAALHAREFADQLSDADAVLVNIRATYGLTAESTTSLSNALAALNGRPDLSGDDKANVVSAVSNRQAIAQQAGATALDDSSHIDSTTIEGQWKEATDHLVSTSEDAGKRIGDIFSGSLGGINESLATNLTGQYHTSRERYRALEEGVGRSVRSTGTKIAGYGLEKAEGGVLGALGLGGHGKPDGSQSSPLWVRMFGSTGSVLPTSSVSSAKSLASSLPGLPAFSRPTLGTGGVDPLGLNAPDTSGIAASLGAGSVDSSVIGSIFQGAFANGGPVSSNIPALVGERGPELFVPRTAGQIIPNHKLMGGGDTHTYHIDARGSNDPAAVEAAVQRGIRQAAPGIMAASAHQQRESQLRKPATAR